MSRLGLAPSAFDKAESGSGISVASFARLGLILSVYGLSWSGGFLSVPDLVSIDFSLLMRGPVCLELSLSLFGCNVLGSPTLAIDFVPPGFMTFLHCPA